MSDDEIERQKREVAEAEERYKRLNPGGSLQPSSAELEAMSDDARAAHDIYIGASLRLKVARGDYS